MKRLVRSALARVNMAVTKAQTFDRLVRSERELLRVGQGLDFVRGVNELYLHQALALLPKTSGENFQDLFAALVLSDRKSGFFVEFGGTDGIVGSNSFFFERHAGWPGIVAEPARAWHDRLATNRRCMISHDCVWSRSGELVKFCEPGDAGFSTIARFADVDGHATKRKQSKEYTVRTISLDDLLAQHGAPSSIDLLSLDTEGSELEILSAFSFSEHPVSVLVVEHNYRDDREAIHDLLRRRGMTRVLASLSRYDDWYVADDLVSKVDEIFPRRRRHE